MQRSNRFALTSVRGVVVLATGLCCTLLATSGYSAAPSATAGAAFPKGGYAALDKLPDWGGVWVLNRGRPAGGAAPAQPKLKGDYLTRYQQWQQQARANNGVALKDTSNCTPPGMPRMMGTGQYPIEFLFTPGRVTMQHEAWMQTRAIFTDGRPHPEDLEAGFFGHSIGRWEGQTLVVDTVGIKTATELETGMKHSDQLQITERIHLAEGDANTLVVETTLTDPVALEAPYQRVYTFKRERDWNLMEFVCAENDRNPVGADGQTRFN
jgi:hypothetical protein